MGDLSSRFGWFLWPPLKGRAFVWKDSGVDTRKACTCVVACGAVGSRGWERQPFESNFSRSLLALNVPFLPLTVNTVSATARGTMDATG